jgi:hypothetical protein
MALTICIARNFNSATVLSASKKKLVQYVTIDTSKTHSVWKCLHNIQYQFFCYPIVRTVRHTEFRASFFCHLKKLRCKSLFIVNVTFKSQILKFSVHVNRMSIKIVANGKIEVNNIKPILHFLTAY